MRLLSVVYLASDVCRLASVICPLKACHRPSGHSFGPIYMKFGTLVYLSRNIFEILILFGFYPDFGLWKTASSPLNYSEKVCVHLSYQRILTKFCIQVFLGSRYIMPHSVFSKLNFFRMVARFWTYKNFIVSSELL